MVPHGAPAGLPRVVVLLDLDGTLLGQVVPAACEVELLRATGGAKGPRMRAARSELVSRLRYGIIRPHVDAFCSQAAAARGVELFVYTASDDAWAAHIVPCVEAALGTRFNRPIFSRKHCVRAEGGGQLKHVARVLPFVARALRKRYPGVRGPGDLRDRVLLVDNTPTVLAHPAAEQGRLLVCPTYAYRYPYDVLAHLDTDALHRRYPRVARALAAYDLIPPGAAAPRSFQELAVAYYGGLARAVATAQAGNLRALGSDVFFAALAAALLRPGAPAAFDDEGVRALARRTLHFMAVRRAAGPPPS